MSYLLGVICRSLIPAKTKFGPLQGIRMTKQELENPQNTAYVWEVIVSVVLCTCKSAVRKIKCHRSLIVILCSYYVHEAIQL